MGAILRQGAAANTPDTAETLTLVHLIATLCPSTTYTRKTMFTTRVQRFYLGSLNYLSTAEKGYEKGNRHDALKQV